MVYSSLHNAWARLEGRNCLLKWTHGCSCGSFFQGISTSSEDRSCYNVGLLVFCGGTLERNGTVTCSFTV